jgi:hypothetical protein
MLLSDDIHEPTILHESPQIPIYLAILTESMVRLKFHLVTLGLKYDILAFCSQWFRKVFQVYHCLPMWIQDIWYEALILILHPVLMLVRC